MKKNHKQEYGMTENVRELINTIAQDFESDLLVHDPEHSRLSESFYNYNNTQGTLRKPGVINEMFLLLQEIVEAADGRGKKWLDIGCGNGVRELLLAANIGPDGCITGTDPWYQEVADAAVLASFYPDLQSRIRYFQGDGCLLGFQDESVDVVLMSSVLTHSREPRLLLEEAKRVLRPGGVLVFFDENNSMKITRRKRNYSSLHYMVEYGPLAEGWNHVIEMPFREMRRRLLQGHLGKNAIVTEEHLDETFGLYGNYLVQYTAAIKDERIFVRPDVSLVPHHPVQGWTPDYSINPFAIMRMMKQSGFRPRLFAPRIHRKRSFLRRIFVAVERRIPQIDLLINNGFWVRADRLPEN